MMKTVNEVFQMRNQGLKEEAYEAAREIYVASKDPYASSAMFWTATDVLKIRVSEGRVDEAKGIYMALERLLNSVDDGKGWMHDAMQKCKNLIDRGETRRQLLGDGPEHLQTGAWGEELAASYLRDKGYVILERDWHSSHRDIDIVARQGECIVFVEVKTRSNAEFIDPVQAVNYWKQRNLIHAINHYIHYRKLDCPFRFDVITIVGERGCENPVINHIEDFPLSNRQIP